MSSPATPTTIDDITPVMEVQSSRPLEEVSTIEREIHKIGKHRETQDRSC